MNENTQNTSKNDIELNMNEDFIEIIDQLETSPQGSKIHVSLLIEKIDPSHPSAFSSNNIQQRHKIVGGLLLLICTFLLMHISQHIEPFETNSSHFFRFGVWMNVFAGFILNEAIQLLFV